VCAGRRPVASSPPPSRPLQGRRLPRRIWASKRVGSVGQKDRIPVGKTSRIWVTANSHSARSIASRSPTRKHSGLMRRLAVCARVRPQGRRPEAGALRYRRTPDPATSDTHLGRSPRAARRFRSRGSRKARHRAQCWTSRARFHSRCPRAFAIVRAQVRIGRDADGCAPGIGDGRGIRGERDPGAARHGASAGPG
jgi:hypothetical protein